ncbi:hypothetical protein Tco_0017922 [Tanacetum coccineum]
MKSRTSRVTTQLVFNSEDEIHLEPTTIKLLVFLTVAASSPCRVKIQDLMLNPQSLIHDESSKLSKSSAISDEQALPHKNILWSSVSSGGKEQLVSSGGKKQLVPSGGKKQLVSSRGKNQLVSSRGDGHAGSRRQLSFHNARILELSPAKPLTLTAGACLGSNPGRANCVLSYFSLRDEGVAEDENLNNEAPGTGRTPPRGTFAPARQAQGGPSPAFVKENIDVLRTMIKELDNRGQEKVTPRKLFNEESGEARLENSQMSPLAEEVRGYSFDESSRSKSRGRPQSAQKH